jgi:hypothetical protein
MQGRVRITLLDRTGRIVHDRIHRNHIVISGRMLMAQLFAGPERETPASEATLARVSHMGVGTGGDSVVDGQTNLIQPVLRVPIQSVNHEDMTNAEPSQARVATTLTAVFGYDEANGAGPLAEAGIFTAAEGGTMYNRVTFDPLTKTKAFKLTLNWKILF